jgi:hypothetical protein
MPWLGLKYCHIQDSEHWQNLERQARKANRGVWVQDAPVPAWECRRGERQGGSAFEDKDYSDFSSQAVAHRFFEKHQPKDSLWLNGDIVACEGLP